jgi:hypothetical protein
VKRTVDLTAEEQAHVRTALRFLRTRCGGWAAVAEVLHLHKVTIRNVANGRAVGPVVAFRVARFVKVGVDDVLAGKFPAPDTCPHCGHLKEDAA